MASTQPGVQLRLDIAYDGTSYHGWQKQPAPKQTVQSHIEAALKRITGSSVRVIGAGRTDAGVHALGQVAAAPVVTHLTLPVLHKALNAVLPEDIRITRLGWERPGFHPQHDAIEKTYFYQIHIGAFLPPFRRTCCYHARLPLDLTAMRTAARCLVGRHDFRSFTTQAHAKRNTIRRVRRIWITHIPDGLRVFVTADGFLYNMVRAFVGALLKVGDGTLTPDDLRGIRDARDRRAAPPNAPPQGLFLWRVCYSSRRASARLPNGGNDARP
jgi:tRNA pseudouridine38-40 synthase